nr:MFS transporter [Desulfobaculum xiamenense]
MYIFLMVLTVAAAVGLQGWRTLVNNFAVEVAGVDGLGMGLIQSVREVPGFLAVLVVYLLLVVSEHRLAALSVAVVGIGVSITGLFPSTWGLALTTLIMSFGFHYYETLNQSLTLQHFDLSTAPLVVGRLRGLTSLANLAVGGTLFLLAGVLDYEWLFALLGAVVAVAGLCCLRFRPDTQDAVPQRKGMVLRSRYWLFYLLTFFAGARRQVFVAFSVFLLVQKFDYSVREITALFVVNNLINWFASPRIGRAINRFGERRVLTLEYASLVLIFTAYAFVESRALVAVLYILDHLFFNFAIAIRTYFQKIADPRDIAPSMAAGFTINHIAAVVIPFCGGMLWMVHPSWVFLGGAGLACVSLVLVQFIRTERV